MDNGYYLHEKLVKGASIGVENKIESHIREFSKIYRMTELELIRIPGHALRKRLFFYDKTYNVDEVAKKIIDPSFIYIRKPIIDRSLIKLLKYVRVNYPDCKILMELFTYPYDIDCYLRKKLFIANFMYFIKEAYYRQHLQPYIDRIITYSKDESIWGIPTIRTKNGIDVDNYTLHTKEFPQDGEPVHLISVAANQIQHGYDRVICGLADYYNSPNNAVQVLYHVVGEGEVISQYKEMVHKLGIKDKVIFKGNLYGKELEEEYEKCDIAVASIGIHRINLRYSSSLKTKEYLAKGIPFIYSGEIDVSPQDCNYTYAMKVSDDDSAININSMLSFIDSLKKIGKNEISISMRNKAYNNVDMKVTQKIVSEYLVGGNAK